jgi:class 3 adenylate cyclase
MISPVDQGSRRRGALLLADISGYTGFLQGVSDAHSDLIVEADEPPPAYAVVSSLLDTMVTLLAPRFELAKFEGDAIFAVAADGPEAIRGAAVMTCVRACHAAFTTRLDEAKGEWTCTCSSCARIGDLGLKFVLHHGEYVVQRIAGREELLGADVNVAHRLLKNHVRDLLGTRPYALLTDVALKTLEVPSDDMEAMTERYDDLPPIPVHVLALG